MERAVMTRAEIARYNEALLARPGRAAMLHDLRAMPERLARSALCGLIEEAMGGEGTACRENCALGEIAPWTALRWGVCVRRSSLRALPTEKALPHKADDRYDDRLQRSAVPVNEPMALAHTSADGRYFFAVTENCTGWVAAEGVGLCPRERALRAAEAGDFLLVTGSRVTLCADPFEPRVSGAVLTMGTRLRLTSPVGTVRAVRARLSCDNYLAALPVRGAGGTLEEVDALVPISADVCEGFLPYTPENAALQAEKLRGEVYGWGGMLGARDCSSLVGEVYRCFGFRLPRDSAGLAQLPGAQDVSALTTEEKRELLCALPRGTLLYFPGHIMLSFGAADGEPLCLSAAGNFLPPGSVGGTARTVNTVAVTPLSVVRANGKTWMESLTRVIRIP